MTARERIDEIMKRFDGTQTQADCEALAEAYDAWLKSNEYEKAHADWLAEEP
jgi:glutamate mutase epsilon subunit